MGILDLFRTNPTQTEQALYSKLIELAGAVTELGDYSTAKRIALNIIVPQMAALTIGTFDRNDSNRRVKGDLHERLNYKLFGELTGYEFWQSMFNSLLQHNNAYAKITLIGERVARLRPLLNTDVTALPVKTGGIRSIRYTVDGLPCPADEIFHLRLNAYDGLFGVAYEKECNAFKLAAEAENMAVNFYDNGGNIRRIWKLITGGTVEQEKQAQTFLENAVKGKLKQHLDIVIPSHIEKPTDLVGTSFKDGQMMESREFQQLEILALYGIDLGNIDLEKIYPLTIVPILENIEQAITKRLLTEQERRRWKIQYVEAGRFRGDLKKQFEIAGSALQIQSINEIREGFFGLPRLGPEYDAVVNPNTASAAVNEERQALAKGETENADG